MQNFTKLLHLAFFVLFLFSFSLAQDNPDIDLIQKNLESYANIHSPNKVYVHTDRAIYALEDTIWFKAYIIDATYHEPTASSKVIYVDVVDSNGNKVVGKKLYAEKIGTASDFFIEREWLPGRYKLRAYTKHMLNQDQKYIYHKDIEIVDVKEAYDELFEYVEPTVSTTSSKDLLDISFFPESGDLVADLDTRVAIKINGYSPLLGDISGTIEDKSGNLISSFKIYEKGYGLASFIPEKGKKYFAKIDDDSQLYPLPEVKSTGYRITTFNKSDHVSFMIASNIKSGLAGGDILIHSRGQLVFHKKLEDTVDESYGLKLETKDMPTGVTHITFFNKDGIPRSERLFFINNDISEPIITSDKASYSKREKVTLDLSILSDIPKSFDCSVAVFDKSNLEGGQPSDNIKTWMLLNSDLRGEIDDPAFYFEDDNETRAYLLDLVMMTHGWRRFAWEDMSQENILQNLEYERELGIYIKGNTTKLVKSKSPVKSKVKINFLNDYLNQQEVISDDEGQFAFGPFVLRDSLSALIQAVRYNQDNEQSFSDGKRNLNINLEEPQYLLLDKSIFKESGDFDYTAYKSYINANRTSQALKDQYHSMEVTLSEITLNAKRRDKEKEIRKIVSDRSIYTLPTNRITFEDDETTRYISVVDMLRDIPGVVVIGSFPNQSIVVRGISSINLTNEAFLLLNGFPIDMNFVNQLSPNDILFIDVLKGADATIFGSRGANGVVAFYTGRTIGSYSLREKSGIVDIVVNGFDKYREFYSPDHSINVSAVYEPDVRTTLLWDPFVLLRKGEEHSITFYTGDNTGNYVAVIEGVSGDGEPIYGTYEFGVQITN